MKKLDLTKVKFSQYDNALQKPFFRQMNTFMIFVNGYIYTTYLCLDHKIKKKMGAQWLSGRVLDSRPKGREFQPHPRHCVVDVEQDTFILA